MGKKPKFHCVCDLGAPQPHPDAQEAITVLTNCTGKQILARGVLRGQDLWAFLQSIFGAVDLGRSEANGDPCHIPKGFTPNFIEPLNPRFDPISSQGRFFVWCLCWAQAKKKESLQAVACNDS